MKIAKIVKIRNCQVTPSSFNYIATLPDFLWNLGKVFWKFYLMFWVLNGILPYLQLKSNITRTSEQTPYLFK